MRIDKIAHPTVLRAVVYAFEMDGALWTVTYTPAPVTTDSPLRAWIVQAQADTGRGYRWPPIAATVAKPSMSQAETLLRLAFCMLSGRSPGWLLRGTLFATTGETYGTERTFNQSDRGQIPGP